MKTALVIRHVAFEDLGVLEPVLGSRGYAIEMCEAGVDTLAPAQTADLLVVLGGPIGVNDAPRYPFLADEIAVIRARLTAGKPVLGICLGAQLIAAAAGARVYAGTAKEIGYAALTLTPAGAASPLGEIACARHVVLHWHGDTFDLPEGATRLALSALTPNQAFAMGPGVLALQFHLEAEPAGFERWLIGHTGELAAAGVDVCALRAEALEHGAAVAQAGAGAFARWLDGLAG